MSFCSESPHALIPGTNSTCAEALSNKLTALQNESYLRPNTGGALLPWIYTVLIILIHTPIVVIRVVKWEIMQAWSICFAVFTIVVVTQSYVSTQFDPARILIWTPIILVIDAGSMIQVFFLVIEAKKLRLGPRTFLVDPLEHGQQDTELNARGTRQFSSLVTRYRRSRQGHQEPVAHQDQGFQLSERQHLTVSQQTPTPSESINEPVYSLQENRGAPRPDNDAAQPDQQGQAFSTDIQPDNGQAAGSPPRTEVKTNPDHLNDNIDVDEDLRWYKDPALWSATFAALSFIAVLVLQVLGLVKAIQGIQTEPPLVEWCSPLFQPFGIVALDGDGHAYSIIQDSNKGIGCIAIAGVWQRGWLKGTVAILIVELAFEFIDTLILINVSSSQRWRGVKMRRPWCSIFLGMMVLLVILICGLFFASQLPPEITKSVTVVMESKGFVGSYEVLLTNAGLRGAILGWSDGLFKSWRSTYFGG